MGLIVNLKTKPGGLKDHGKLQQGREVVEDKDFIEISTCSFYTPARRQLVALTIGKIRCQRFEQVEFWWSKRWNLTGGKKLPNEA